MKLAHIRLLAEGIIKFPLKNILHLADEWKRDLHYRGFSEVCDDHENDDYSGWGCIADGVCVDGWWHSYW